MHNGDSRIGSMPNLELVNYRYYDMCVGNGLGLLYLHLTPYRLEVVYDLQFKAIICFFVSG